MKVKFFLFTLLLLILSGCYGPTGCYGPMIGTVVEETGKPVEGAVIYIEWPVTMGLPGMQSARTYKVVEKVTDKDGKFRVEGVLNPMVNRPIVIVYKKGYVAWRSDFIFPNYEHRKDFTWTSAYTFHLNKLKRFSHYKHIFFITSKLNISTSLKLYQAYRQEGLLANKEEDLFRKKLKRLKPGENENRLWEEMVQEIYEKGQRNEVL